MRCMRKKAIKGEERWNRKLSPLFLIMSWIRNVQYVPSFHLWCGGPLIAAAPPKANIKIKEKKYVSAVYVTVEKIDVSTK